MRKKHRSMLRHLLALASLMASMGAAGQSYTRNFVLTSRPTEAITSLQLTQANSRTTVAYADMLGRPEETVSVGAAPTASGMADLVEMTVYDCAGRDSLRFLPLVSPSSYGQYVQPAAMELSAMQSTYPDDGCPYGRTEYEASFLDRKTAEYGAGEAWHTTGKAVTTEYLANVNGGGVLDCARYSVTVSGDEALTVKRSGSYPTGALEVVRTTDEDGRVGYAFSSGGRTLLTRQLLGSATVDTYYIYDAEGFLRAVLPPLAADAMGANGAYSLAATDAMAAYAYLYQYDGEGRLVKKRLPGCAWTYYAYDGADHLVATQDGNMRQQGKWLVSLSDALGREVLTALCTSIGGQTVTTSSLNGMVLTAAYAGASGAYMGYDARTATGGTVELGGAEVLTACYYDSYAFMADVSGFSGLTFNPGICYGAGYPQKHDDCRGLLTGSWAAVLNPVYYPVVNSIRKTFFYDARQRVVQRHAANIRGGQDWEAFDYAFSGEVTRHYKWHSASASGNVSAIEEYAYTYDTWGRQLTATHTKDGGTVRTIADNTYDTMGRLVENKRNGHPNNKTTYTYNIRSWLTSVSSPMFTESLYYNESHNGSTAQWGGNVSAMDWRAYDATQHGYTFSYDGLSRLTYAKYLQGGSVSNRYTTQYAYDKMGNVTSLMRNGKQDDGFYNPVDILTYTHEGNRVTAIKDYGTDPTYSGAFDFEDGADGTSEYEYDANGNMTKDLNKGITAILYNVLNLPRSVTFSDGSTIIRSYAADGTKLRELSAINNYTAAAATAAQAIANGAAETLTALADAPAGAEADIDAALAATSTTLTVRDYCDNAYYEQGSLKRLLIDGGYYDIASDVPTFYHLDHLGSVRAATRLYGTEVQRTHYYPFGGIIGDLSTGQDSQPYKYNGKELSRLHGLDWHDYGARMYDAATGRWTGMDPKAEKYYSISPYAYCANNPMNAIDRNGMDGIAVIDKENKTIAISQTFYYNKNDENLNKHAIVRNRRIQNASLGDETFIAETSIAQDKGFPSQKWTFNDGENDWIVEFSCQFVGLENDQEVSDALKNDQTANALIFNKDLSSNGEWNPTNRTISLGANRMFWGSERGSTLIHEIGHSWGLPHENSMETSPLYGNENNGKGIADTGIMSYGNNRTVQQYEINYGVSSILSSANSYKKSNVRLHIKTSGQKHIILK